MFALCERGDFGDDLHTSGRNWPIPETPQSSLCLDEFIYELFANWIYKISKKIEI